MKSNEFIVESPDDDEWSINAAWRTDPTAKPPEADPGFHWVRMKNGGWGQEEDAPELPQGLEVLRSNPAYRKAIGLPPLDYYDFDTPQKAKDAIDTSVGSEKDVKRPRWPSHSPETKYLGSAGARAIQKANPSITDINKIQVGSTIKIPGKPDYKIQRGDTLDKIAARMIKESELDRILKLSGLEFIAEDSVKSITVQRGDTLGRIAADNSTTVDAIVKLNNIANPDRIFPGDVIKIPTGQVAVPGGRAKRQGSTRIPDRAEKLTTTTSTGNPKIAMEFFLDQGWTPEQAAGLVANLQAESYDRIDPAAENGGAYGIAQWRGSRKRDFEQEMGMPLRGSGLMDQLKFVQHELNNKEAKAGRLLKQATTAAQAAAIVDEFYERSGGAAIKQRIAAANSLLTTIA